MADDIFNNFLTTPTDFPEDKPVPIQPLAAPQEVSITPNPLEVPLSASAAEARGQRYAFATKDDPQAPDEKTWAQRLLTGQSRGEVEAFRTREIVKDIEARDNAIRAIAGQAAAQGRDLSASEVQALSEMSTFQFNNLINPIKGIPGTETSTPINPIDPDEFMAKKYGDKFASSVGVMLASTVMNSNLDARQREQAQQSLDGLAGVKQKQALFQKLAEEADLAASRLTTAQSAAGFVRDVFTPGTWIDLLSTLKPYNNSSYLQGSTVEEAIARLWTLPPQQAYAEARTIMENLAYGSGSGNPDAAVAFAKALNSYSTTDKYIDNVFGIVNSIPLLGAVFDGAKAVIKGGALGEALKASVKATSETGNIVRGLSAFQGDVKLASLGTVWDRINTKLVGNPTKLEEVTKNVTSLADPAAVTPASPWSKLSREFVDRLGSTLEQNAVQLVQGLGDTLNVERLSTATLAWRKAVEEATAKLYGQVPRLADAFIDVRTIDPEKALGNVGFVEGVLGKVLETGPKRLVAEIPAEEASKVVQTKGAKAFDLRTTGTKLEAANANQPLINTDKSVVAKTSSKLETTDQVIAKQKKGPKLEASNDNFTTSKLELQIGKPDVTLFDSAKEANTWASKVYGLKDYNVEQMGEKFAIKVYQPIDETSPTVRAQLAIETKNDYKGLSSWLGWFKGADENLSKGLVEQRKVAVNAPQKIDALIRAVAKDNIATLDKDSRKSLAQYMEAQRNMTHPGTGAVGYFDKTVDEFALNWEKSFNRLPTLKEAKAYFTAVQISDLEWMAHNIGIYSQKTRQGISNYRLPIPSAMQAANDNAVSSHIQLEGKIVDGIPSVKDWNPKVLVWDGNPITKDSFLRPNQSQAKINELINDGYKVIKISEYSDADIRKLPGLDNLGPEKIRYVLTKDYESAPLDLAQIPYRPGGHKYYLDNYFVSQPNIKANEAANVQFSKRTYYGDTNIYSFPTEAQGRQFVDAFNKGRELLKNGRLAELDNHLQATLPHTLDEFTRMFRGKNAPLDENTPVYLRSSGKSTWDAADLGKQFPDLIRASDDPHSLYRGQLNLSQALERNETLRTVVNKGSAEDPIFKFEGSRLMDPLASINRSTRNIAERMYLDDVKLRTVEEFAAKFGDLIQRKSEDSFWNNPFKNLTDPKWVDVNGKDDLTRLQAAKNFRRSSLEFLGIRGEDSQAIKVLRESIMNTIGTKYDADSKPFQIMEKWLLHRETDPAKFMRQVGFGATQFFNPASMLTQAMGSMNAIAISPKFGMQAVANATAMQWSMFNDRKAILNGLERVADGASEGKGFLQESMDALRRTGFDIVNPRAGGDINAFMDPRIIDTKFGKFEDWGSRLFKAGDQFQRLVAWNIAFLDWKNANKGAEVTDKAIRQILSRADDLTMNMSRASAATWQSGILSIPTQFFGYHARLMELMWGEKLTTAEKTKLFAINAMAFGLPTAAGLGAGFYPWHEMIAETAARNNIDTDSNKVLQVLNKGLVDSLGQWVTGRDINTRERYGPQGMSILRDVFTADKYKSKLDNPLMGLFGKTTQGFLESTEPIFTSMAGAAGLIDGYYPSRLEDYTGLLTRNINVLNNVVQAWGIINSGTVYTKKGQALASDIPTWMGFAKLIAGINDGSITDAFARKEAQKEIDQAQQEYKGKAIEQLQAAVRAAGRGDFDSMSDYNRRASAYINMGGFRPDERAKILRDAMQGGMADIVDKANRKYYFENPERMKLLIEKAKQ